MDLWITWIVGLIGHLGLWCVAYNHIHATALPRSSRKFSEKIIFLIVMLPIVYVATTLISWEKLGVTAGFDEVLESSKKFALGRFGVFYLYCCVLLGIFFILRFIWRKFKVRAPASIVKNAQSLINVRRETGKPLLHGVITRMLGAIPLNQIQLISQQEMTFKLDVSPKFDGLKICQISDLHLTGRIGVEYFEKVVELANAFQPDIVVITGDIVDNRKCLAWLDQTLGKLRPNLGCYYVLGNHDRRIREEEIYRGRLESMGLMRAAGRWKTIKFNGVEIKITGNELPWYKGAESLPTDAGGNDAALKILLSHSPDQIDWAEPYKFDLMFAGHTHGGQVVIPVIGPLVAPSKFGVLYASGTFQVGDTLMHVSRGISGDEPIRFFCPPELGLFTIRSSNVPNEAIPESIDAHETAAR